MRMSTFAFYSDAAALKFFDGPNGEKMSWVHALPGGDWKHPVYGDLKFTDEKIGNYVKSVKERYREVDPDIDYDHKQDAAMGNRAAGWVKDAKAELNSGSGKQDLWLLVEWTPNGFNSVKSKEYRYFSSELADKWTDQNGKEYQDVVFGGGITNRPYMKNLVPLNLAELTFGQPTGTGNTDPHPTQGDQVDPKELRRKLGLSETASDADVDARIASLNEAAKLGAPPANTDPNIDALAKLAETNPAIQAVLNQLNENNRLLKEANERAQLAETHNKLRTLATSKFSFSAAQLNEATALMVGAPQAFNEKLFSLLKNIVDNGLTQLGEAGLSSGGNVDNKGTSSDAIAKFNDEVAKLTQAGGNPIDAMEQVAKNDPQLYAEYRKAVYIPADAQYS